jgi:hypothetical protein
VRIGGGLGHRGRAKARPYIYIMDIMAVATAAMVIVAMVIAAVARGLCHVGSALGMKALGGRQLGLT